MISIYTTGNWDTSPLGHPRAQGTGLRHPQATRGPGLSGLWLSGLPRAQGTVVCCSLAPGLLTQHLYASLFPIPHPLAASVVSGVGRTAYPGPG